jgi:hypothetical protein
MAAARPRARPPHHGRAAPEGRTHPELADPGGPECLAFARTWLAKWAAGGWAWPFEVETFRTRTGTDVLTFSRFVAVVRVNPDLAGAGVAELNADVEAYARAQGYGRGTGG